MTTTARPRRAVTEEGSRAGDALAGTWTLLRLMLRRDRIRLPGWVLGITALMAYFTNLIPIAFEDVTSLEGLAGFTASPVGSLLGGPGYGMDEITLPRFLVAQYVLYLILAAILMSILTVTRHTRVEEQTGRAELLRAGVVGRHAQLTAAVILTVAMNVVLSVLLGVVFLTSGMAPEPASAAWLTAFSIGAAGIAFTGVSAVTVQLTPFSRTASGMAGIVLGAFFVVRGLGDMSRAQGGKLGWLSWLSPIGWSQQTAPFTLDRWWPLVLPLVFGAVLVSIAWALQSRRDLDAGLLAARAGNPNAMPWLRTPLTLAFRLQRGSLVGWSYSMFLSGIAFGSFTQAVRDAADAFPDVMLDMMGGADQLVDGYLGLMALLFAVTVSAFVILSIQGMRAEELESRLEPVLANAVGRRRWILSWTGVTAFGAFRLLFTAGVGESIGAWASTGDSRLVLPSIVGHSLQVPAVWFVMGLACALYGLAPRLVPLAWIPFGYGAFLSFFGPMLRVGDKVMNASPYEHVGQYPLVHVSWYGVSILTIAAVVLVLIGMAGFRRRDLITT